MNEDELLDSSERLLGRFDFAATLATVEREHYAQTRKLLTSFIEVMDSFDRLFGGLKDSLETATEQQCLLLNSVRLISRQMERALQNAGVKQIPALDLLCDSDKHFIVDVKESPGIAEDTIVQEVLKGYEWDGEVLRFPHVIVAGKPSQSVKEK
jgi:molecular chaperone GrpE